MDLSLFSFIKIFTPHFQYLLHLLLELKSQKYPANCLIKLSQNG